MEKREQSRYGGAQSTEQEEDKAVLAMTRARRRQDEERMKARARRIMGLWSRGLGAPEHSPRAVGRNAATHCRPCSCHLCSGHKDVPPKRERGFDYQG